MARGEFTLFEEFATDFSNALHNLKETHVLKLGLVDDTITPLATIESPTWGDYSANEVATTGNYTADGETLTFSVATRWAEADGVGTLDADDLTISQDGSGFTDAHWGILYNDTAASDQAIGFLDLGGPVSEQDGDVTISWNASGILTVTIS